MGSSFARCPGLFVRHVRRRNEPLNRGAGYVKRSAVRIRRIKNPGADAPRLAWTVLFRVFLLSCFRDSLRELPRGTKLTSPETDRNPTFRHLQREKNRVTHFATIPYRDRNPKTDPGLCGFLDANTINGLVALVGKLICPRFLSGIEVYPKMGYRADRVVVDVLNAFFAH